MAMLMVILTALVAAAGLVLGSLTVRDWNPDYDPDYLRDTVHQGVVAFLKIGLLLLLLCLAAVAVAGGIAADRDGVTPRVGLWFCAVVSIAIGLGFVVSWTRRRLRRPGPAR